MRERMLNISVIKSVGHLSFDVRGQVDRKKRVTHHAKIARGELISVEIGICMQGVQTTQFGKL